MPDEPEKLRRFELLLANFQAIGKGQSFFVNSLTVFLCLVWAVDILNASGGISITILGANIQLHGLWPIVPLVTTALTLGLLGSLQLTAHAWRRLDLVVAEVLPSRNLFFSEFDPHKNILDYFASLTLSLRKPVWPDVAKPRLEISQKWNLRSLLYPTLILVSIFTSWFTLWRTGVTWHMVWYVAVATLLQSAFAVGFVWRKMCLFFGVHKHAYDGFDWGTDAYYDMELEALGDLVRQRGHNQAP